MQFCLNPSQKEQLFFFFTIDSNGAFTISRPAEANKLAREHGLGEAEIFNNNSLKNAEQKISQLEEMCPDLMDVVVSHVSIFTSVSYYSFFLNTNVCDRTSNGFRWIMQGTFGFKNKIDRNKND